MTYRRYSICQDELTRYPKEMILMKATNYPNKIEVRIDDETLAILDEVLVAKLGKTRSVVVRNLIRKAGEPAMRLTKDIQSTSIHPITEQKINEGVLPSGMEVVRVVKRVPTMTCPTDNIQFVVRDSRGEWLEEADESDLVAAGITVSV